MRNRSEASTNPAPLWLRALQLIGFILLSFLAAASAAWIGTGSWYSQLHKPAWAPPGWIFGPVWTALYIMMGTAAWGVWRKTRWSKPIGVWFVQLALNAAWTPIFFGLHQPGWAFAEIVVLWAALLACTILFARAARWAGWMMVPYLLWVSFASILNFAIWRANT